MTPILKTIPNFRDCGGGATVDGRHLRSGRMCRSGTLDDARVDDRRALRTLGLKTIIDLRAPREKKKPPAQVDGTQRADLPIELETRAREKIRPLMTKRGAEQDIRSRPVYEEAQRRYLEANRAVAEAIYDEVMQLVEEQRQALEQSTGQAIRIEEDRSQSLPTAAQLAWAHQRDYHLIKYHAEARAAVPNLLLRSLEHIAREIEVRQAGRARHFRTTATTKAHAQKFLDDYIPRLRRRGLSPDAIDESVNQIIEGPALQLFNSVLDMVAENRVYQKYASARPSQFVSLHVIYQAVTNIEPQVNAVQAAPGAGPL